MFARILFRSLLAGLIALPLLAAVPHKATAADEVTVFAAASLKDALDAVVAAYAERTGKTVLVNYAGSSTLARQIEQGAPADIFFSADLAWMDYLDERDLIRKPSRVTLLGNEIVLAAPKESAVSIAIAPGMDLVGALGPDGRLAMANTDSVPAGRYGKAALVSLGVWDSVADRVVQADNVRAALAFVARGETPLGIVYRTDAAADPAVKVVDAFPAGSHPPILYPAAIVATSASPDADAFFDFMRSPGAKGLYEAQGFTFVAPGS